MWCRAQDQGATIDPAKEVKERKYCRLIMPCHTSYLITPDPSSPYYGIYLGCLFALACLFSRGHNSLSYFIVLVVSFPIATCPNLAYGISSYPIHHYAALHHALLMTLSDRVAHHAWLPLHTLLYIASVIPEKHFFLTPGCIFHHAMPYQI